MIIRKSRLKSDGLQEKKKLADLEQQEAVVVRVKTPIVLERSINKSCCQ